MDLDHKAATDGPEERRANAPGYPPIGDYGAVGDGHALALVSTDGSVDWLCWPDFDSPSLFAAILDRERGGAFRVGPAGAASVRRRYRAGTAVLETTFSCPDGVLRLTDAMAIDCEAAFAPVRQMVRAVEALEGAPEIAVAYAPRPNYGLEARRPAKRGRLGWFLETGAGAVVLASDTPLAPAGDGTTLVGGERLPAGERRRFSLAFAGSEPATLAPLEAVEEVLEETTRFWRGWTGQIGYDGPYRDAVVRSIVTLKLLTYAPSGAVVAAPTTSLPEAVGQDLNWDYRFCWLRDASLTLRAFMDLGYVEEGARFIDWLLHATHLTVPRLRPIYDVFGRIDLPERPLPHLAGYRGSRPVRIGNAARSQRQLDVYGMMVLAAFDFVERGGRLDRAGRRNLAGFGEMVRRCWKEPDNGIWEVRGMRRRHTHSALMCWAALDRLVRLHDAGCLRVDREGLAETRDAIRSAIETEGWSECLGAYAGVLGGECLDASVLVMARVGFCPAGDPRLAATRERLRAQLGEGPLLRRYDDTFFPASRPEASFSMCSFWEVDYLVRRGDVAAARRQFEGMLALSSDLGLFAEEIEPADGTFLGNFPQAFTHAGVVNGALMLAHAEGDTA